MNDFDETPPTPEELKAEEAGIQADAAEREKLEQLAKARMVRAVKAGIQAIQAESASDGEMITASISVVANVVQLVRQYSPASLPAVKSALDRLYLELADIERIQ